MKIRFQIHYHTQWGQNIAISGISQFVEDKSKNEIVHLNYNHPFTWEIEVEIPQNAWQTTIEYKYLLFDEESGTYTEEWGKPRIAEIDSKSNKSVMLIDSWRPVYEVNNIFYSSAFTDVIMKRNNRISPQKLDNKAMKVTFRINVPRIGSNHFLAIIGNNDAFGSWNNDNLKVLTDNSFPTWQISFDRKELKLPLEFKYVIADNEGIKTWEQGSNRYYDNLPDEFDDIIITGPNFRYPFDNYKTAGVAIPVFSLKSKESCGVGDFGDLKLFIDWAAANDFHVVQVLPVNDTVSTKTHLDSYPYKAISVIALHPIYLNINRLGIVDEVKYYEKFIYQKQVLNDSETVDYEEVMKIKSLYYKKIYDQTKSQVFESQRYIDFFNKNREWLVPYAAYSYLRDKNGTANFREWPKYSVFRRNEIEELCSPDRRHYDDISVHYYIQYQLHTQLMEAVNYAKSKGVIIKGDIPIGISPNSIDAWMYTNLFNFDGQTGAPPDDFAEEGQNWGFPTYNWDEMKKDNYAWWRMRLEKMAQYFGAYRIDHILGFFRIWEIPEHAIQGILGHFKPDLPLSESEFVEKGINFSEDRYCKPFINDQVLHEYFGEYTSEAIELFLTKDHGGKYIVKNEFDTQKKSEQYFTNGNEFHKYTKRENFLITGINQLLADVLLLPVKNKPGYFHPRVTLYKTKSFKYLSKEEQDIIYQIYIEYFYKRHEHFWKEEAMKILPHLINSTGMLVCGEDLGMIPTCVPDVMRDLNILSLEIQRMPKEQNVRFIDLNRVPYLSVCTPSTHDMATIREWWEDPKTDEQDYYNNFLKIPGIAPLTAEPWLCQRIIEQHLFSPAVLSIFPLQDIMAMDEQIRRQDPKEERINEPSNPKHYWRYRMHLTIEDLLNAEEFNYLVKDMVNKSQRNTSY